MLSRKKSSIQTRIKRRPRVERRREEKRKMTLGVDRKLQQELCKWHSSFFIILTFLCVSAGDIFSCLVSPTDPLIEHPPIPGLNTPHMRYIESHSLTYKVIESASSRFRRILFLYVWWYCTRSKTEPTKLSSFIFALSNSPTAQRTWIQYENGMEKFPFKRRRSLSVPLPFKRIKV